MSPPARLWISDDVHSSIIEECGRKSPLETGGVLLGYWAQENGEPVVTGVVGPGPDAVHERYRFIPDHEYQLGEIARLYEQSGRSLDYLGDWHSHPDAEGELSEKDLKALSMVARHPTARVENPIMLVMAGRDGGWQATAWMHVRHAGLVWGVKSVVRPLSVAHFAGR